MHNHGTRTCYVHAKCRCDKCSTANSEYNLRYNLSHKEYFKNKSRVNYLLNADKKRKYSRDYRIKNKQVITEYNREYKATNKELYAEHQRRRSLKIKYTDITIDWLKQLIINTPQCELCNTELTHNNRQLDHIWPLGIGGKHLKNNVRYICKQCNLTRPKKLNLKYA